MAAFFKDANAPGEQLISWMADLTNVFYNTSGQAGQCFNTSGGDPPGLQGSGWDIQCCREVAQPIGQYGMPNDFWWPAPFNLTSFIQGCQQQFGGLTPRPYWQLTLYGGLNLDSASNIVFANGQYDPWRSGGIVTNHTEAPTIISLYVAQGAHHLDLRSSNPADPPSVVEVRNIEMANARAWINQHYERKGIDIRV
jgi:lysosomal Pro-X carboxypeptidase